MPEEDTPASSSVNPAEPGHEIRTYFVRNRNALVARGMFSELYVDYFLHNGDQHIHVAEEHAALFKRALAGFVLHLASCPWNQMSAWTIHFKKPLLNIFLTGDNSTGTVTGRVFAENVSEDISGGIFYADTIFPTQPKRRSTVEFEGDDPLAAIEKYYVQSEQRPTCYFQIADEDFVMVIEHPDCDAAWFKALTTEAVRELDKTETLSLLERRLYRWHCGCNHERMMQVLAPAMRNDPAGLFDGTEKLEIRCPRCAARHTITREAMEAFVARKEPPTPQSPVS